MNEESSPPPAEGPASPEICLKDTTKDGGEETAKEGALDEFLKHLFGSCGGVVDVATFLLQSTCRNKADAEAKREAEQQTVTKTNARKVASAANAKPKKRQGETLIFPAHGGFDDDVSAISAHTLEEMERLEILKKKTLNKPLTPIHSPARPPFQTSSTTTTLNSQKVTPKTSQDLEWAYQVPREGSNASRSLGVSTSGSASEDDDTGPGRIRISSRGQKDEIMKIYTRAEV